jgi:hypothetical protein
MATYIYDYHEERGEFHAHVTDEAGNVVWEVKYPEYLEDDESGELIEASTIFEDGYLKNADDLEGLYYYLRDWGAIEEDDVVVKKEDYEKQQPKDDLLEFTIPMIMANAIVNGEDYFLTENESEQLYNFLQNLTARYGNANLMLGDESDELGFRTRNDVNNLGGDCIRMYLKPSKNYDDGGNLPQSEYGYGTSLLAKGGSIEDKIKSRLSANFELPVEMAIYVPSTEKANQVISKRDYLKRIDDVRSFLATTFGGYSSDSIDGGYVSDEKGLIQEDVTKVTAFSTKEKLEDKVQSLIAQIRIWCKEWGQESIGFEFEGDMFYVDKDAKFVDGGGIPEGYHMMPDGTIMPNSAHMDKGGEVDDEEEDEENKDEEHLEYISEETNIPIDVLKEYASNKGIDISELDTDLGFRGSYEDEEKFAEQAVEEGINNLSYYLEMYDTDKRIFVDAETDSYMDGLDNGDILSQSSFEDDAEQLKEAEANLSIYEEQLEEVQSEKQDFIDSQDVEEMTESDREDMDSALEEFDKRIEELESDVSEAKRDIRNYGDYDTILDKARDEVREQYYDDLMDRLNKDAVGYFVDELDYDEKDLVNKNGFFIDYAAVAKDLESDYDFIYYGGEVYVFSSYYKWGGGIDLGKSFEKFKQTLNEGAEQVQSQLSDNDIVNMAMESVGDAWEDLTSNEQLGIIKGFREGYGKGQLMAKGGEIDPSYTHFAVRKSDGKIVTGWEYNDVDKQSIKYYTTIDLKDMDFKPSEFRILTSRYLKAKGIDPFDVKNWWNPSYDLGGSVEEGNLLMLKNKAREFEHHAEELQEVVEKNPRVDAWVVAKAERASSDLSDITHYLEGQVEMDDEPAVAGQMAKGGELSLANKIRLREINEQIKEEQKTIDEFDEDDVQREYDRFGNPSPLSFNQQVVIAAENNLEKLQEERKILLESKNMPKGLQVTLGDYEFDEHGWAYSYGKFKAKNRSFGFMVSVDPNEKASVSWDEPYMQNATWDKKIIDEVRKDMPITNEMAKGGEINTRTFYVNTNLDSEFQDLASNVGVDFEQVGLTSRSFVYEVQGTESQISKLDDEWLKTRDDYEKYERKRKKNKMYGGEMAKGGETKFVNLKTLKGQSEVEKYLQKGWSVKYQGDKFAILQKGGKKMVKGGATFDDKVKAISKNLKGRKVPKKLQKDYGKTYDTKQERDDAARRIAGAMRAEEMGTRKK